MEPTHLVWRIEFGTRSFEVIVEKGAMAELICAMHAFKDGTPIRWFTSGRLSLEHNDTLRAQNAALREALGACKCENCASVRKARADVAIVRGKE